MTKIISLPVATSHTVQGPVLVFQTSGAKVLYDTEEGGYWTEISFEDVLGARTCVGAACSDQDVLGFDYMVEEDTGAELELLVNRWTLTVGWQERERNRNGFKLFRVFFDDAASIVVVARNVSVRSPVAVPCSLTE